MAKILHLITRSIVGGSQDNTFCTAERHDRSRFEVHVACNPDGAWVERAQAAADVFHPLPDLVMPIRPLQDLRALVAIIKLLRRERFDLVHTHTAKAGFLGRLAAALCDVPLVVHTYHAFPFHDHMPNWKRRLFIFMEQFVRRCTHGFITVSERERELGLQTNVLSSSNSRTIYSGIDFQKLDQPGQSEELRQQLQIPPDHTVILMAGRLDAQKAPQLLLQAFRRVLDSHPRTSLLIAGDGELRPLVEETIAQLKLTENVKLLGFRSDLPDLIKASDLFALSSLWEGLGRAMTEAMLLGKAVVVPNANGIPEIVHDGETGLLYETGNVAQLAARLCWLLEHPREREDLGQHARELTRDLFDLSEMVDRIEDFYRELWAVNQEQPIFASVCATSAAQGYPAR